MKNTVRCMSNCMSNTVREASIFIVTLKQDILCLLPSNTAIADIVVNRAADTARLAIKNLSTKTP